MTLVNNNANESLNQSSEIKHANTSMNSDERE